MKIYFSIPKFIRKVVLFISILGLFACQQDSKQSSSVFNESEIKNPYDYSMILPNKPDLLPTKMFTEIGTNEQDLLVAIKKSGEYIIRNVDSVGRFNYLVNTNPGVRIKPTYNMLRHAGAIYSLSMYNELMQDDASCRAATTAMSYLSQTAIGPAHGTNTYGVWTFSDVTLINAPPQIKLGGCGLGLIALAGSLKCDDQILEIEKLKMIGDFIIYMQMENGGFFSKYIPEYGGKYAKWNSLYYPGEAILGLMFLNRISPDKRWVSSAILGMNYLAQLRKGKTVIEADHWALIATNQLLDYISDNEKYASFKPIFINHAIQICEYIIDHAAGFEDESPYQGCFGNDGRTTPTATRLEGLLNAYMYIPGENHELRDRIEEAVHHGIAFLIRSQIKEGKFEGGIPGAFLADSNIPETINATHKRNTEIRIDYVQHALSAMLLYHEIFHKN